MRNKILSKSTVLLIPMRVFCHLVREIGQGIKAKIRWQSTATFTLQNGAEDYMIGLSNDANLCAIHAWRQIIMPHDIQLA